MLLLLALLPATARPTTVPELHAHLQSVLDTAPAAASTADVGLRMSPTWSLTWPATVDEAAGISLEGELECAVSTWSRKRRSFELACAQGFTGALEVGLELGGAMVEVVDGALRIAPMPNLASGAFTVAGAAPAPTAPAAGIPSDCVGADCRGPCDAGDAFACSVLGRHRISEGDVKGAERALQAGCTGDDGSACLELWQLARVGRIWGDAASLATRAHTLLEAACEAGSGRDCWVLGSALRPGGLPGGTPEAAAAAFARGCALEFAPACPARPPE